jgi:hypothetical protein
MQDPTNVVPDSVSGTESQRLLRPQVSCPRCGSRPALRITEPLARAAADEPAARRMGTYQCQRRGCGAVYDLSADAFRQAR